MIFYQAKTVNVVRQQRNLNFNHIRDVIFVKLRIGKRDQQCVSEISTHYISFNIKPGLHVSHKNRNLISEGHYHMILLSYYTETKQIIYGSLIVKRVVYN